MDSTSNEQKLQELASRPDSQQAASTYKLLQEDIVNQLQQKMPDIVFVEVPNTVRSRGCGVEYSGIDERTAVSQTLGRLKADRSISDDLWPQAFQVVQEVSAQQGFANPQVLKDQPGDHDIVLSDAKGARLSFGTAVNSVLSITTGCHLTPLAHKNGGSLPPSPPG